MNNKTINLLEVTDALNTIEILLRGLRTVANDQHEDYFALNPDERGFAALLIAKHGAADDRHTIISSFANDALEQITALNAALDMKLSELGKEQETA